MGGSRGGGHEVEKPGHTDTRQGGGAQGKGHRIPTAGHSCFGHQDWQVQHQARTHKGGQHHQPENFRRALVNTDGRPPQIRPKIRTRAALIKPLVISTMPISKPGA